MGDQDRTIELGCYLALLVAGLLSLQLYLASIARSLHVIAEQGVCGG